MCFINKDIDNSSDLMLALNEMRPKYTTYKLMGLLPYGSIKTIAAADAAAAEYRVHKQ